MALDHAGLSYRGAATLAGISVATAHALTRNRPSLPVALLERAMAGLDLARAEALRAQLARLPQLDVDRLMGARA